MQEFWSQVIPMQCPHCQGKSPGFRKDGNTKIFQRPLSEKARNAMIQEGRLRGAKEEDAVDTTTIASSRKFSGTAGANSESAFNPETGHSDVEEEDEDMAEEIASGQQKMLTVQEVRDHIEKLWFKEKELLDLIYGRYYPAVEGEPFVSDSLGYKMFFMNKLIVPPNRFRPESQGGFGGGGGAEDKAFLHAHSAMISKVLKLNIAIKDAILLQRTHETTGEKPENEKPISQVIIQQWIQLQDAINTFMDSSMA